jgi:hypothetical protein
MLAAIPRLSLGATSAQSQFRGATAMKTNSVAVKAQLRCNIDRQDDIWQIDIQPSSECPRSLPSFGPIRYFSDRQRPHPSRHARFSGVARGAT